MENKDIEKLLIKRYRKTIWSKFTKAINTYNLIQDGDRIAVCISGGKDSFIMAKLFQELKRHGKINFDIKFIVMNPGYKSKNLDLIKSNSEKLEIPIEIFDSNIFEVVDNVEKNPCYLCARMRRGFLYSKAQELGCNKIALGHHFDDVIETILLSTLYAGDFKTMMPKLHSTNFEGLELIRPMYLIKLEDIISWVNASGLEFLNCACNFTEKNDIENKSKRVEIRNLIKEMKKTNKNVDINIFRSASDVNLETIIGYHKKDFNYNFLDDYEVDYE